MSIYAQEEHCTWVVSSVLVTTCPGCWWNADSQIFLQTWWCSSLARWLLSLLWFFVQKSRTILVLLWSWFKKAVIFWLVFFVPQLGVTETHYIKWFRVVWPCPSFCWRNHTIRCMSRVWHQPSQIGKAYDWFQCWYYLGSSETVPDHPGVTVATLCWGFRTQQNMIFCCLITFCHMCGDSPPFLSEGSFYILPHFWLFLLVLWVFHCFQIRFLVSKGPK